MFSSSLSLWSERSANNCLVYSTLLCILNVIDEYVSFHAIDLHDAIYCTAQAMAITHSMIELGCSKLQTKEFLHRMCALHELSERQRQDLLVHLMSRWVTLTSIYRERQRNTTPVTLKLLIVLSGQIVITRFLVITVPFGIDHWNNFLFLFSSCFFLVSTSFFLLSSSSYLPSPFSFLRAWMVQTTLNPPYCTPHKHEGKKQGQKRKQEWIGNKLVGGLDWFGPYMGWWYHIILILLFFASNSYCVLCCVIWLEVRIPCHVSICSSYFTIRSTFVFLSYFTFQASICSFIHTNYCISCSAL